MSGLRNMLTLASPGHLIINDFAVLQMDHAVGVLCNGLIMGHDDYRFPGFLA